MIFLFPLVLSGIAAVTFLLDDDVGWPAKLFHVGLAVAAAALQFVPALRESVHFTVPLLMQLYVCAAWYFLTQLD